MTETMALPFINPIYRGYKAVYTNKNLPQPPSHPPPADTIPPSLNVGAAHIVPEALKSQRSLWFGKHGISITGQIIPIPIGSVGLVYFVGKYTSPMDAMGHNS